jgi:phosphoribosylformylglycinamidine synthase
MWQFARAVEGMGAACRTLDIPITGGNVSLYNETDGRGVLPTPVIGVVGLIEDANRVVGRAFRSEGDIVVLLGETANELGGSEFLHVVFGQIRGVPPKLDLAREGALQRVLVEGAASGVIRSAHDCVEGGMAITLAECCFDTPLGVDVDLAGLADAAEGYREMATLFSESASRVIVSVAPGQLAALQALAASAGVPAQALGRVGGNRIQIAVDGKAVVSELTADAERIWAEAIGSWFADRRAIA